MTRLLRLSAFLLVALAVSSAPVSPETRRSICPLSEVRAGQIAVAKSVFRGAAIESFHVKIIGVIPKYDGSRSIILGRILDGTVVARKSGTIGGMSGSPVYINGRLAGAISMTWAWSKEPIAGITPIEEMLEALREPPKAPATPGAGGARPASPVRINGATIGRVQVAPVAPSQPDPPGVMTLVPLSGLVQVSGFNQRGIERVQELLSPYGLRVSAGGAGVEEKMRPPMVPGAAVGARLIGGDFDMTALGTITLVEGNRVLAFGHPLLQRGDLDLPMTGGYVYDIMPNLQVSNKIMSPTQVVGRVTRDHQTAIAGTLGGKADMLPVTIEVTDSDMGRSQVFHVEVARVRELMPGLVASAVVVAVDEMRGEVSRGTARVRVEMDAGGRTFVREDMEYSAMDAAAVAAPDVLTPLNALAENPFGMMRVDRLRVKVNTAAARRTASIERVTLNQTRVKAGDEVTFMVAVHPYGEAEVEIPVKVKLPADLPKGQMRVAVTGGSNAEQARAAIGAPRPAPVNIDQIIERYVAEPEGSDLVIQAALPRGGVSLSGEELPNLPRTAIEALGATRPTDLRPLPSVLKVIVPTDWVLTGRQTLLIGLESPITGAGGPPKGPREGGPPEEEPQPPDEETGLILPLPGGEDAVEWAGKIELGVAQPRPGPKPTEGAEEKKETALTRAADTWTESTPEDYDNAKLVNVALAGDGALSLSLKQQTLATIPDDVLWSVAARDGQAYVGTGKRGRIFRVSADGQVSQFAATGEMNVHSLAFGSGGQLYAGTSPKGKVIQIDSAGKSGLAFDSDSTYIWALVVGPDGTVYAGAGSPGRVYAIKPGAAAKTLAELPVSNVLSLALGQTGELYAGTSDGGLVFRIAPDGAAAAVGQVPGASVNALALDANGTLYATSSPGGQIYRVTPGGKPELYLETGQQSAFGLALLPDGTPVVATGPRGLVIRAPSRLKPELLLMAESGLATAITQDGGALYVGTSGPSILRKLGPERAESGSAESDVLDAERVAAWGRADVSAETPEGTQATVETRSGDSPLPDAGWSTWAPTVARAITSPPARYLQYRLTLSTQKSDTSPIVRQVSITRRPQNRAPQVTIRSPETGERLAKQESMKWQAQDQDKDPLTFRVEVSSDFGATWTELAKNLRDPKYDWDTTKQKDGRYLLRVTATDALSEPDDPLSDESIEVVWVDNAAPAVMLFRSSVAVDEERRAKVGGMASDQLSPIRSIEYRVDTEDWRSLPIGAVETSLAAVSVATDPLAVGKHKLTVRAFDAAGNVASNTVDVEVKEATAPSAPAAAPTPVAPVQQPAESDTPPAPPKEEPKASAQPESAHPAESPPAAPAPKP